MSKQYSVFVSYADEDGAWVEGYLLNALEEAGLTCHSEAMFRLGVPRLIEFESAVKNSERTLLVISPAYLADNFVEFANLLFQSYGLDTNLWPVVGIILHPVQELPMRLKMLECLDATDGTKQQKAIQRICENFQKPVPTLVEIPDCPYPGMVPFKQEDSDRFFGRQREVNDLIQHLRLYPFLAVIGASGSGKSSLVFAGLIPQMQKTHLLGKEPWQIYSMRPGTTPITTLTATLGCDLTSAEAITTKFKLSQKSLLVIDQFEEIFTLSPQDVTPFQEILLNLYKQPNFYVVLTVRADFYPQLMESTCFWREIKAHRYEVLPLDQTGLQEAILNPAEQAGVFIEAALLERLITTVAKEPGVLPLLQETLVLLWEKVERRYLPLRAYEALVLSYHNAVSNTNNKLTGIQVAIAQRADAAIADLSDEQQIIARRVFLRLIQFGEGRADTRRQESVEALKARGDNDQIFEKTLRYLADRRLLTLSGKEDKTRKVDIAHEILISSWPQLQDWIIQRREAEQTRRRLIAKVEEWVRLGKGEGGLLDEFELAESQRWLDSSDAIELGSDDQLVVLVELSKTAIEDEKQQKLEAQERELDLIRERLEQEKIANENKQKALESSQKATQEEKKGRRIAQNRNRILAASLVVMAGLSAFAVNRMIDSRIKTIDVLSSSAESLFDNHQKLDALIDAVKAGRLLKNTPLVPLDSRINTITVLRKVIDENLIINRLEGHTDWVSSISFSPDEQMIASSSADNKIMLWDGQGVYIKTLSGHDDKIYRVTFNPHDGQTLASASADQTVKIWSSNGELVHTLKSHTDQVSDVAFSPNGQIIVSSSSDKTVKIWTATGELKKTLNQHTLPVQSVSFSRKGDIFASCSEDKTIKIWDLQGTLRQSIPTNEIIYSISFSPDGKTIASVGTDKTIKLWNLKGKLLKTFPMKHQDIILAVSFRPDGKKIASASADGTVNIWTSEGQLLQRLQGHTDQVVSLSFNPSGTKLASTSRDKTVLIWNLMANSPTILKGHEDIISNVAFSHNGKMIVSASKDKTIKLWTPQGELLKTLEGHQDFVRMALFSPNDKLIASASQDGTVKLWNVNDGKTRQTLTQDGNQDKFMSISFSPNGQNLVAASTNKVVKLWNLKNSKISQIFPHNDKVWSVTFSPNNNIFASSTVDREIKIWRTDGTLVQSIQDAHTQDITRVTFSPDGRMIASASKDGDIKIWKADGTWIHTLKGHKDWVLDVQFSPDGKIIASASSDNTIKLWNLPGKLLATLLDKNDIFTVAFSPDGQLLASGGFNKTVTLWNLNLDDLLHEGCHSLKNYLSVNDSKINEVSTFCVKLDYESKKN